LAPWLALGRVDVARRDPESAFAAYRKATEIDPSSAEAWYGRGVTARDVADRILKHISIADHQQTAASQSPQQNKTREMLEDAQYSLSRATSIDPDSTHAHMILGEAFRVSGELDNSVVEYQAILKVKPDFAPAYLGLANTYWKFDRTDEAVSALKKVLSLRPDDPEANGIMAHLLVADQQTEKALPFAERALAKRPDLSFVRVALAKIYLSEGKPQEALPQLEKAVPDDLDGSYHYVLFQTLRKLGRNQEAVAALHESQRLLQGHHS
jgi:tetratricopeptide (TPR) repeat protein